VNVLISLYNIRLIFTAIRTSPHVCLMSKCRLCWIVWPRPNWSYVDSTTTVIASLKQILFYEDLWRILIFII
jgi:hypothetical protein